MILLNKIMLNLYQYIVIRRFIIKEASHNMLYIGDLHVGRAMKKDTFRSFAGSEDLD